MRGLLDTIKSFVVYDADRDFYARVFPDSVPRSDLLRMRTMTHADLPSVLAIEAQNYEFPWSEDTFTDCFQAQYHCHVCEELDKVLGYCILAVGAGEAHILNISVDPGAQKQGVGKKMLNYLIESAKGRAETIFLEVRPSNTVALALYKKTGFNEIGLRKGYYPAAEGREDALMLAMELF